MGRTARGRWSRPSRLRVTGTDVRRGTGGDPHLGGGAHRQAETESEAAAARLPAGGDRAVERVEAGARRRHRTAGAGADDQAPEAGAAGAMPAMVAYIHVPTAP
ncbi:hypothetical protein GCM10010393_15280 [Streptomyces gobitricini]|uniref:Uncharacterized protein n=1 Tax=Streptomyces gobitricini TaxID=68211 RepID=A0ABP5YQM4_9ACTN